jgi:hypothetical protein
MFLIEMTTAWLVIADIIVLYNQLAEFSKSKKGKIKGQNEINKKKRENQVRIN